MFRFCSFLLAVCIGRIVSADPPATSYIFPAGGQRGTTAQCRVGGLNLSAECGFRMLGGGAETPAKFSSMPTFVLVGPYHHNPIAQQAWDYPKDMSAAIKIALDAPLGLRHWFCTTSEGATQLRPFVVGDLPEVIEDEEKTKQRQPQQVTLPVTINGRIYPRADLDEFVFEAKTGVHLSCEVMSQRLGHKLDAKLLLHDAAGRLIAESDDGHARDPLLFATIPADGRYLLRIHDIAFEGDQDYVYRISLRTGPYVTHVFPAGARHGETVSVRLYGSGLGQDRFVAQRLSLEPSRLPLTQLAEADGLRSVPGPVMASLMSASAGATTTPTPGGSGSTPITSSGSTTPAAILSGLLVSCPFHVSDATEFVETEPNIGSEHAQRVTLPAVMNGQLEPVGDEDEYAFVAIKGQKLDFEFFGRRLGSPISGVCSILDSTGKQIARQEGDSRLAFVAPADDEFRIRIHELHRETHGGSEFVYRLVASVPRPDFRLVLEKDNLAVLPGQTAKIKLNVTRLSGFVGEIQVAATELPSGVTLAPATVAGNQNQAELSFTAAKDSAVGDTRRGIIIGTAVADGQRLLHTAEVPAPAGLAGMTAADSLAVTVTHPPLFAIDTEEVYGSANRGATFVQRFTIARQPGFDGEIALSIADRQARYLQGAIGPLLIVQPGQKEVDYPVFFPEVMDLNRTSRVLLMGTAKVSDAAGRVHYVTSTTNKQVVVRVSPAILSLTAEKQFVEATRGQTIHVPLRVGRAPGLTGQVTVEAVLPADAKGITAGLVTSSEDQESLTVVVEIGPDAQLGIQERISFRATGQRGGYPVIAETALELQLTP